MLLLAGWLILDLRTWRYRRTIARKGKGVLVALVVPALVGAGLIGWSVSQDRGMWWLLGAGMVAAVQVAAAMLAGDATDP